jgi:YHS domain-containing protein
MRVTSDANALEYGHMHFWLCSEQCRLRFQDRPERYVSGARAGERRAPPRERIKRRRLRLGQTLRPDQGELVRDLLEGMMGVRLVSFRGDRLEVTYDGAMTGEDQIERELAEAGDRLGAGWADRLRRAFIHYEEETEG